MPNRLPTPKGYRKLKEGERIDATDIHWMHGTKELGLSKWACSSSVGEPFHPEECTQYYRAIETTPKTKETKTMTTKKPGASHGKPTAKGMKEALKPKAKPVEAKAAPKPKYQAPRVQIAALVPVKPLDKMTKAELIEAYGVLKEQFDNQAADHCIAGTKLDRALVDLKEAKAKIKELSKGTEAAK